MISVDDVITWADTCRHCGSPLLLDEVFKCSPCNRKYPDRMSDVISVHGIDIEEEITEMIKAEKRARHGS